MTAARPGAISLGGGLPSDELFPRAALARAFVRAMREPRASALQYAWPEGREQLREWIAARLRARGANLSADDVIVTSGAQQALAIAAQLCFRRGEPVGVDSETYPAALDLFATRGAQLRCGWDGVRCFYAMPAIGNPHGHPMADEDRRALVASRIHIVEDDAYAELRFDGAVGRPLVADDRDCWRDRLLQRGVNVRTYWEQLPPGVDKVGTVYAISVETGQTVWKYEQRAGTLSLVATGGGLVFGGDDNGRFRAFDDKTGKVLWETNLGAPVSGFPISFAVGGKQFVAVSTGTSLVASSALSLTPELKPGNVAAIFVFALP